LKGMLGQGVPEWQAKGILELYVLMDKGDACMQLVTDDFKNVVGHKSHSPSTWIGHQGHHFIPHPEEHHDHHHQQKKDEGNHHHHHQKKDEGKKEEPKKEEPKKEEPKKEEPKK